MKKLFLLLMGSLFSLSNFATGIVVQLYGSPYDKERLNKNEIPVVTYDDNTVTVTSDSLMF
jgi:hypothetical protein